MSSIPVLRVVTVGLTVGFAGCRPPAALADPVAPAGQVDEVFGCPPPLIDPPSDPPSDPAPDPPQR